MVRTAFDWNSRRSAIESIIEADPVAACASSWKIGPLGQAPHLTSAGAHRLRGQATTGQSAGSAGWPRNPRALASRLRRAQTFLRTLGIEISFSRDGRAGTRLIRITVAPSSPDRIVRYDRTVRTVSSTGDSCNAGDTIST
jgi:hypothetical protein